MKVIYLLHFYQPDFQFRQFLESVYNTNYKNIFEAIKKADNAKVVINITASTIEILNNYNVGTLIDDLKELYKLGKVEFTATSLSHVLLSHADKNQALRQVKLDYEKKSWYLGVPQEEFRVLFPPEISVNQQVLDIATELEFDAVIIPDSSLEDIPASTTKLKKDDLKLFKRSLRLSRIAESTQMTDIKEFYEALGPQYLEKDDVYVIAHDAEILGGADSPKFKLFEQLLNDKSIEFTTFKEELKIDNFVPLKQEVQPGTWEKMPINGKMLDVHWKNPNNKIHTYQWKLSELVVKEIEQFPDVNIKFDLQTNLDYCQYSCQYWWASSYPFWSPGIISHAAWTWLYLSYKVYGELKALDQDKADKFIVKVEKYYMNIIKHLAQYDLNKWHEKNIAYYDQFILPSKLKYEI